LRDGKFLKGWSTPSRLVEFTSKQAAAKKDRNGNAIDAQPIYTPRDWFPSTDFPLYLINWKEASHTHSRTHNNPWLIELMGWNRLAINTATAARLDVKDGDEIWVESLYGKAKALARITQGIHPEVVGWQHGFGHWGLGHVAQGKGTADGSFNKTIADPISGMALHKEVCVKVYKA
jgi:anaerobic selenocysteine-containing dehydrogenase